MNKRLLLLLFIGLLLIPLIAQDDDNSAEDNLEDQGIMQISNDEILISFSTKVPLEYFIRLVALQTQKIFIYDPLKVSNLEVYILADKIRIKSSALYALLLALLEHQQMTIQRYGEYTDETVEIYKIMPLRDAVNDLGEFKDADFDNLKERAALTTMIVHLRWADPNSVYRALRALIPQNFNAQPIMSRGLNAVLISGLEYQIKRISKMIEILDQPGPQLELAVIPVKYADVTDFATMINTLLQNQLRYRMYSRQQSSGSTEEQISLEADERTNSIIVQATADNISIVRALVKRLDIPIDEESESTIHIYFCKHSKAEDLSTILGTITSSDAFKNRNQKTQGRSSTIPGNPWDWRGNNRNFNNNNTQDQSQVSINSDERTNSLIITAIQEDYLEIRKIIDELDIRRPQVMIEAAIIEISADENLEFGFEFTSLDQPKEGSIRGFAGTNFGYSDVVDSNGVPIADGGGLPAGKLPKYGEGTTFGLWQNDFFSIPVILRAVQTVTDANVLSRPKILTNDGEEATIKVEDQEPTITTTTSTTTDSSGFGGYEEAGITFTITPSISEQNYLRLELKLVVESFATRSASTPDEAPPPKTSRTVESIITIPDQQTIVIGGLTSTRASKKVKKVPLLGDIPLLGELFKASDIEEKRTNLYIFIRPTILREGDFADLHSLSRDELKRAEEETLDTEEARKFFRLANEDAKLFELDQVGKTMRKYKYVSVRKSVAKAMQERQEEIEKNKSKEKED